MLFYCYYDNNNGGDGGDGGGDNLRNVFDASSKQSYSNVNKKPQYIDQKSKKKKK